jgi:hypothetical protein
MSNLYTPNKPNFNTEIVETLRQIRVYTFKVEGFSHTMHIVAPDRLKAMDIFKNLTNWDNIKSIENTEFPGTSFNQNSK